MDGAYLSAIAALAGSAVGGLTSFFSTWLGQSTQLKAQLFLHDKGRKQELYREFVEQASKAYADALTHDNPEISKTIELYALISRMRVLSSPGIVKEAETVTRMIVETYPQPNKTFTEVRAMVNQHALDPLRAFSESCRDELQRLR